MNFDTFDEKPHDINELLNLLVERSSTFTNSERTVIYLYDEHDKILWNRAGEGAELMELEFKYAEGIPGHVIEKGKTFVIQDVAHDTRFDPRIDDVTDVQVRSMVCTPIVDNKDKRLGVIQLINKREGEYTERDIAFVESMAAQAAIAIDNTLLFTSLQAVRKRELELADQIKEQNEELQQAYLKVESEKEEAESNSQTMTRNRILGTAGFILLVLVIGLFAWRSTFISKPEEALAKSDKAPEIKDGLEGVRSYEVTTTFLSFPLTLSGALEPANIENMYAPFSGQITYRDFIIGETVEEGQEILKISTDSIESRYRQAKIAEVEAREEYEKRKNWEQSKELLNAKRDVLRQQNEVDVSKKLFSLGIISQQNLRSAQDALEGAQDKLETVEKEGGEIAVQSAEFKWKNQLLEERKLYEKLQKATIKSPIEGVAILPPEGDANKGKLIEPGVAIEEGKVFVSIADLSQLKVLGRVDETDIAKVKVGQEVEITGEAFPGITLKGTVVYISSEARTGGRRASFDIRVETLPLNQEQKDSLRLGMSATLSIATYTNPEAILVPFDAIKIKDEGSFVYRYVEGQAESEEIKIETGVTTPSQVEVTSGLNPGDRLILID